jgi:hypothetical protein
MKRFDPFNRNSGIHTTFIDAGRIVDTPEGLGC